MTKEDIIKLIGERLKLHTEDAKQSHESMIEACDCHNVDRASKYSKWELQSYVVISELEFILTRINHEEDKHE